MSVEKPESKRRASTLFTVAAVILIAAIVFTGGFVLSGIDRINFIEWYRVDQPTELKVGILTGPSGWWRVTDVRETAYSVTITVRTLELNFGPQSGVGYPRELGVHLALPLGDRTVVDGLGHNVLPQTID